MKEITIPSNYTGTIYQENEIIKVINENFLELEDFIQNLPDKTLEFDKHIADFEEYSIELYFSDNKKNAVIEIDGSFLKVTIGNNTTKIDFNGNVI